MSTIKPAVPLALTMLPETNAAGATAKLAVAVAGSGMVNVVACPIAAFVIFVNVLPVLAVAVMRNEPRFVVPGIDWTHPAVPVAKPACRLPGLIAVLAPA